MQKNLRVFVASPGDVQDERDIVSYVVEELSRNMASFVGVNLEAVRWETHGWPDVGDDAQDVINNEIGVYDLLVGIMWKRFGTPTKRASSGTEEEFIRAYEYFRAYRRPKIMFYFKRAPFYTTDEKELTQFAEVVDFRKRLEKLGVLFWEFQDTLEFERRLREHLMRQLVRIAPTTQPPPTAPESIPKIFISYAREDLEIVEEVYAILKSAGFAPWLDVKDIKPGQRWKTTLRNVIRSSDLFLACFSRRSIEKKGYVQRELRLGLDILSEHAESDIYIIPVRLEPCDAPSQLAELHWIDFFAPKGKETLVRSIQLAWKKLLEIRSSNKFPKGS